MNDGPTLSPSPSMSDSEFWAVLAAIEWTVPPDWSVIRADLIRKLKPIEAEAIWWIFRHKMRELDRVVNEWEMEFNTVFPFTGEDRVDLLSYIVGLGEADYHAAFKLPELVIARAKRSDFYPGMLTAIPSASAYGPPQG